jgi:hypothetical protein
MAGAGVGANGAVASAALEARVALAGASLAVARASVGALSGLVGNVVCKRDIRPCKLVGASAWKKGEQPQR